MISLHVMTKQERIVITEPIISNTLGTSNQIIKPAIIAPGTDKYLMGAKTTASPNLNAYVNVNCKHEPAIPITTKKKISFKLITGSCGGKIKRVNVKKINPIVLLLSLLPFS